MVLVDSVNWNKEEKVATNVDAEAFVCLSCECICARLRASGSQLEGTNRGTQKGKKDL